MKPGLWSSAVVALMAAAFVPEAVAQIGPQTTPTRVLNPANQGLTNLTATQVVGVQDNPATGAMTFSLRLVDNTYANVNLHYSVSTSGSGFITQPILIGGDWLDPVAAGLFKKLALAKQNDSNGFFANLTFTSIWVLQIRTKFINYVSYTVNNTSQLSLDATRIPFVPSDLPGGKTRGGLVTASVYALGTADVQGWAFPVYGKVTLQREDPSGMMMYAPYRYDWYPVREAFNFQDPITGAFTDCEPLTPGPKNGMWDVNSFYDTVLQGRILIPNLGSAKPLVLGDARFIISGCEWTSQF